MGGTLSLEARGEQKNNGRATHLYKCVVLLCVTRIHALHTDAAIRSELSLTLIRAEMTEDRYLFIYLFIFSLYENVCRCIIMFWGHHYWYTFWTRLIKYLVLLQINQVMKIFFIPNFLMAHFNNILSIYLYVPQVKSSFQVFWLTLCIRFYN
jgi:hypothetical protein